MQKFLKIFLFAIFLVNLTLFGVNVEKVFLGVKYSFESFQSDGNAIFVDPFNKKMIVYDLSSKSIVSSLDYVGNFVIGVYQSENGYVVVDKTGHYISKISKQGFQVKRVVLRDKIQGSLLQDDKIYILLENGELYVFDTNLNQVSTYKFSDSPDYIFSWNKKILVTYQWNDNYDVEFINEKPRKIGLMTPSILVGDLLIDTRGGQAYNLKTGKTITLAPYISSGFYDGTNHYIACMSNLTVYIVKNDSVQSSFKVPYPPTAIKKIGNLIVTLSAQHNKVMVTVDGKDVKAYETGDNPQEIFKVKNSQSVFSVYCSDNGYMYYYHFK